MTGDVTRSRIGPIGHESWGYLYPAGGVPFASSSSARCNWGDAAKLAFGGWSVVYEETDEGDYQGSASFVGYRSTDGWWCYVTWDWGSCEGCDSWLAEQGCGAEADAKVARIMKREMGRFRTRAGLVRFLRSAPLLGFSERALKALGVLGEG